MVSTSNIVVTNNIISCGLSSSTTTPVITYYDHLVWIRGSALIDGNIFSEPSENSDMLNITDGNCIITNNKFNRRSTTINSYIRHHSTNHDGVHQITDNYFDQPNIDGSIEELVKDLNVGTTYTRNKNQTCLTYIPLFHDSLGAFDSTGPFYGGTADGINVGGIDAGAHLIEIRRIKENSNRANLITNFRNFSAGSVGLLLRRSFYPVEYIAPGTSIIDVKIGAFINEGDITDYSFNYFKVSLKAHNAINSMNAANYSFLTPSFIVDFQKNIVSAGDLVDLKATTIYNDAVGFGGSAPDGDYSGFIQPDYFGTSNGYLQELLFEVNISFDAEYDINFTPIEIKYRF